MAILAPQFPFTLTLAGGSPLGYEGLWTQAGTYGGYGYWTQGQQFCFWNAATSQWVINAQLGIKPIINPSNSSDGFVGANFANSGFGVTWTASPQLSSIALVAVTSSNSPVTSTTAFSSNLRQQLADVSAVKQLALQQIAAVIAAGAGPSYSLGGPAGSESLDMRGFLDYLTAAVKTYAELEGVLLDAIQDLTPFQVVQQVSVCGGRNRW
jgi:hypothetical protein